MSFVYAEKETMYLTNQTLKSINIFSETKIGFKGAAKLNWPEEESREILKYGMIKSIIISPTCCLSFAGNNVLELQKLFKKIRQYQHFDINQLLNDALNLHLSLGRDELEMIICYVDESNDLHITCIKEGKIQRDCQNAWIGSRLAFEKLQELRCQAPQRFSTTEFIFQDALSNCKDDSVGLIPIVVRYSPQKGFIYPARCVSSLDRATFVPAGTSIPFSGTACDGGFTVFFAESQTQVRIDFEQGDFTLLYTPKIKSNDDTCLNDLRAEFLTPTVTCTGTNIIL